ncbi:glyoxylase-like metal-dependent hydrolase (beta-lactamase superfamily II) [Tumebacillus sp. BK434]|uniref:MBL fold metallo-hydrolase n=1 Tax=Tumebacillus sp. BK434 TaxID=2512169 RepID=UPI001043D5FB|nr:MBL fold metallo-hydrolase [Tumebacillus sp. BK434]TCP52674.1 glyoxylase-like metal-dependent hydrolase (beta-lactamase superfamily II) [Tumebacillus sp. BK434]
MTVQAVNAKQLHQDIEQGKALFLLDVRNPEDYADWKIESAAVQSVNIPYFDFLDDNDEIYADLPKDAEIVVICAKGGSALMVAELLDERGYTASYLEEGMKEWSQFYHPITIADTGSMKLVQFNRLAKGCLSYMVISDGEAVIVDPGRHVHEYLDYAEAAGVKITGVMDTHLHADHISGGLQLAERTDATYYISASEMQGANLPYAALEDHENIRFGRVDVQVLSVPTPGHTPGSTSFLVNGEYLLSGDTIFVGGLGRPDLGGKAREWAQSLYDTVFSTIANLSDEVLVLPTHFADIEEINAHGYVGASLGAIRQNNAIMRTADRAAFTEAVAGAVGATPPNYTEIVDINRGVLQADPEKAMEVEIGPNRCALKHQ